MLIKKVILRKNRVQLNFRSDIRFYLMRFSLTRATTTTINNIKKKFKKLFCKNKQSISYLRFKPFLLFEFHVYDRLLSDLLCVMIDVSSVWFLIPNASDKFYWFLSFSLLCAPDIVISEDLNSINNVK